ncbi:2890_t:CDS:2 [Entrophospora sp. SA101]|nr:8127_t:CDS:2 [Entrophospora sp. SA101]CAJ0766590.1 2890_t:CDS:2 [Entrophospora sp. SA101]
MESLKQESSLLPPEASSSCTASSTSTSTLLSSISSPRRKIGNPKKRTTGNLMDLISKSSAYKSDPPTIILPDFFYLGDSKTACWLPHFVNWNITHVINLSGCSNFWETKDKIDYEISNLEFDDEMTKDLDEFKEEVVGKDINNKKAKESNGRVYVHCYAGISRSTTVVIAYLMYSCRFSLKKALNLVREKHKIVRPNSGFIRQLEKFEKEISLKD